MRPEPAPNERWVVTAKGVRIRTIAKALAQSEAAGTELVDQFEGVRRWADLNETLLALVELRAEDRLHLEHTHRSAVESSHQHLERARRARDQGFDVSPMIGAVVVSRHEAELLAGRLKHLHSRIRALLSLHELTRCCVRSLRARRSPQLLEWLNTIADTQCDVGFVPGPDPLGDELELARLRDELMCDARAQAPTPSHWRQKDQNEQPAQPGSRLSHSALTRTRQRRAAAQERSARLRRRTASALAGFLVTLLVLGAGKHWLAIRDQEDSLRLQTLLDETQSASPSGIGFELTRWEAELDKFHSSEIEAQALSSLLQTKARLLQNLEGSCRERVAELLGASRLPEAHAAINAFVSSTRDLGASRWASRQILVIEQQLAARRWARLLSGLQAAASDAKRRRLLENYLAEGPPKLMQRAATRELGKVIDRLDEAAYAKITNAPFESRREVARLLRQIANYHQHFPLGTHREELERLGESAESYDSVLRETDRTPPNLRQLHTQIDRALATSPGRFEEPLRRTRDRWSRVRVQLRLGTLELYDGADSWADLFSLPDLELTIRSGERLVYTSFAGSDSALLHCGSTVAFVHAFGRPLRFGVFDKDITESEWLADHCVNSLDQLHGGVAARQFRLDVRIVSLLPAGGGH
jgi:hypothetical protein